jgi:hypothetical protein
MEDELNIWLNEEMKKNNKGNESLINLLIVI